jgi:co-chaperonin GroES (HSP10)|tara:strand:+ start:751 stop:1029 length:279 start_codon:yes stop_codon:yes gene_type:complete
MSKEDFPTPVNRMILVEVIQEQDESPDGILVPKGYKDINPHSTARVLSVSPSCTLDVREGSEIVFETSVLEEVKTKGKVYNFVSENYVVCVL